MSSIDDKLSASGGWFLNGWTVAAVLLIAIILTGGIFIWVKQDRGRDIEISLEPEEKPVGQVFVGGDVNNPGLYPLRAGDSIDDILEAAGGLTGNADPARLELTIMEKGEAISPQKVDINRAEAWLLAALPGIGETRAQAIIDYRQKNGLFRDINELMKVPGLGSATFEAIKYLVTVTE